MRFAWALYVCNVLQYILLDAYLRHVAICHPIKEALAPSFVLIFFVGYVYVFLSMEKKKENIVRMECRAGGV